MENKIKLKLTAKMKSSPWQTPFYLYDLNQVETNFYNLQNALTKRFSIFYSMKSNPHELILKKLQSIGCLIDVSSKGEVTKAFEAGFSADQMSFVGPGKSQEELNLCLERNIEYTIIESLQELELFSQLALEKKKTPKFCIRVSPDKFVHTSGQIKTNSPTHFGMEESEVLNLREFLSKNKHLKFAGLHFYLQSQYLKAEWIVDNFKLFTKSALKIQAHLGIKFEMLNFGGGFGIPYFEGQIPLDMSQLNKCIESFLSEEKTKELKDTFFFVESGRFISGTAGIFVTKVLYTKTSHNKKFIVCDGGMTQHQSAIGVGQVIRRHFPMEVIKLSSASSELEKVSLVGPSCYSIDVMASDIEIEKIEQGDFVIVNQSGAYGATFSPQDFLSRPHAGEYTNEDL